MDDMEKGATIIDRVPTPIDEMAMVSKFKIQGSPLKNLQTVC